MVGKSLSEKTLHKTFGALFKILVERTGTGGESNFRRKVRLVPIRPINAHETPLSFVTEQSEKASLQRSDAEHLDIGVGSLKKDRSEQTCSKAYSTNVSDVQNIAYRLPPKNNCCVETENKTKGE